MTTRWWHVTCLRCGTTLMDCLQVERACCTGCEHHGLPNTITKPGITLAQDIEGRKTMDRAEADQAWDMMTERAMTMMRAAEMQAELPPASGPFLHAMEAGISFGIAAAAEHYREHPEHVPDPESPV